MSELQRPRVAIVGGTGAEGFGLALRLTRAGARVLIGSREAGKAEAAAGRAPGAEGRANSDAVREAEIVVLTVPLAAQIEILKSVRESFRPGAILVDTTVPLEAALGGRASRTVSLWAGSAAQRAAQQVPDGVAVVAAFHSLSARSLADVDRPVDTDILICGDSASAKAAVRRLVEMLPGARAIDAGPLENARLLENVAALLIALNVGHRSSRAGLRITGLDPERAWTGR